jgi:HK97 family phage prohead protease
MERKLFELKDASVTDNGTIEGLGAVYGNVDAYGDVLAPMSCRNVPEFVKTGCMTIGHDWSGLGIAYIEDAKDTPQGLWFRAKYYSDDESQRARAIAKERLAAGKFVGLSIGWEPVDAKEEMRDGQQLRVVEGWNCYEIAQVIMPANSSAGAIDAKSFADRTDREFASLKEISAEWGRIKRLRKDDGRNWPSDFNRSRIEAFAAEMDELQMTFKGLLEADGPVLATEAETSEVHRAVAAFKMRLAGFAIP